MVCLHRSDDTSVKRSRVCFYMRVDLKKAPSLFLQKKKEREKERSVNL